jgi:hypothetical protein
MDSTRSFHDSTPGVVILVLLALIASLLLATNSVYAEDRSGVSGDSNVATKTARAMTKAAKMARVLEIQAKVIEGVRAVEARERTRAWVRRIIELTKKAARAARPPRTKRRVRSFGNDSGREPSQGR